MERLTDYHLDGSKAYMVCSGACIDDEFDCNCCPKLDGIVDRLVAYEDTGLDPEEVTELMAAHGTAILELSEYRQLGPKKHLQELAQAEKDGRLMVLPFCVGTTLYGATKKGVREYVVEQFSIGVEDLLIHVLDKGLWYRGERIFDQEQIGKTVFLTRKEAEAALKKREEEEYEID